MGVLEAHDVAAELRQSQPLRHLALEHATLAPVVARAATLAGDHQDEPGAMALRLAQEGQQRGVRLALGLAVEVDAVIERFGAAGEALLEPPVERLGPGRGPCSGCGDAGGRTNLGWQFRLARRDRRRSSWDRLSPQRRDRAREMAPKLAVLGGEPSRLALVRAHDRGRHRTVPTWRRNFFALDFSSVLPACCLGLPFSFLTSVSGILGFATGSGTRWLACCLGLPSSFLTSASGILGFATGSGMCLPASIISSSRGSSMTKRPGWRMRPAIRA